MNSELEFLLRELSYWTDDSVVTIQDLKEIIKDSIELKKAHEKIN